MADTETPRLDAIASFFAPEQTRMSTSVSRAVRLRQRVSAAMAASAKGGSRVSMALRVRNLRTPRSLCAQTAHALLSDVLSPGQSAGGTEFEAVCFVLDWAMSR